MATPNSKVQQLPALEALDAKMAEISMIMDRMKNTLVTSMGYVETDNVKRKPILSSFDLEGAAKYMGKCSNIIVMCGAGVSTSAGIPDFRTPGTGLYSQLEKYNLPTPESIFTLDYFNEDPKPFYLLAKELCPGKFKPTAAHYFMKLLHEKNKLLRVFTQNIDSLEKLAGIPAEKIFEAHGSFSTAHCLKCRKEFILDQIKETFLNNEIPHCDECSGLIKPDIVFFGESLPEQFIKHRDEDLPKCDFLIIMGTSLVVAPFNSLVNRVDANCPRLLINMNPAGSQSSEMGLLMFNPLRYDADDNYRDVFHKSSCDEGVTKMAQLLGWTNEFQILRGITPTINRSIVSSKPKATAAVTPTRTLTTRNTNSQRSNSVSRIKTVKNDSNSKKNKN